MVVGKQEHNPSNSPFVEMYLATLIFWDITRFRTLFSVCAIWLLNKNKMKFLQKGEIFMVTAMYEVQVKDRKRAKDLMLMLGCL